MKQSINYLEQDLKDKFFAQSDFELYIITGVCHASKANGIVPCKLAFLI